jgi:hypothetical protein
MVYTRVTGAKLDRKTIRSMRKVGTTGCFSQRSISVSNLAGHIGVAEKSERADEEAPKAAKESLYKDMRPRTCFVCLSNATQSLKSA